MPFTQRASKAWYRLHCIDLRTGDCKKIESHIKSWMYQDRFIKPQECLLFRDTGDGVLGLLNIAARAQACLLRSFIKSALNPEAKLYLLNNAVWRHFVLEEDNPSPDRPHYLSQLMINRLKQQWSVYKNGIIDMMLREWYKSLLSTGITHTSVDENVEPQLIPSRA